MGRAGKLPQTRYPVQIDTWLNELQTPVHPEHVHAPFTLTPDRTNIQRGGTCDEDVAKSAKHYLACQALPDALMSYFSILILVITIIIAIIILIIAMRM